MLILTRKTGESILIGDNIRVVVLEVRGRQIRVGIEAPADIVVLREEIAQRLANENLQAADFQFPEVQQALRSVDIKSARLLAWQDRRPGSPTVIIESKALGRVAVPQERIITFVGGLAGFPNYQQFALINEHLESPFYFLQCLDNPSLAFVLADPVALVPDYRPKNGAGALRELDAQNPEKLQILVTLTIPPGQPREMTANLTSPLLINLERGLGKQVIIEKPQYSHQHPVISIRPGCQLQPDGNGNALTVSQ